MDLESIRKKIIQYDIHKTLGVVLIFLGILGVVSVASFPELTNIPESEDENTVSFSLQLQYVSGLQNEGIGDSEISVTRNSCEEPLEIFETSESGYVVEDFPESENIKWCYDGFETREIDMEFFDSSVTQTLDLSEKGQIRFFPINDSQ